MLSSHMALGLPGHHPQVCWILWDPGWGGQNPTATPTPCYGSWSVLWSGSNSGSFQTQSVSRDVYSLPCTMQLAAPGGKLSLWFTWLNTRWSSWWFFSLLDHCKRRQLYRFLESYFKGQLLLSTTQACNSLQLNKIFILASWYYLLDALSEGVTHLWPVILAGSALFSGLIHSCQQW